MASVDVVLETVLVNHTVYEGSAVIDAALGAVISTRIVSVISLVTFHDPSANLI